jgi:hypothetical protein
MFHKILVVTLLAGAATALTQAATTQLTGVTLTNGISSLSDYSALYSGPNTAVGVSFLTDNDIASFAMNVGASTGSALKGSFSGPLNSAATGIMLVGFGGGGNTFNGNFTVQLQLAGGGLTAERTYGDAQYVMTSQSIGTVDNYWESGLVTIGNTGLSGFKHAYLYIPFTDFNVSRSSVIGVSLSEFADPNPEISFIGAGYVGDPSPIPEPSTYGPILGLVFAGAAIRRRITLK